MMKKSNSIIYTMVGGLLSNAYAPELAEDMHNSNQEARKIHVTNIIQRTADNGSGSIKSLLQTSLDNIKGLSEDVKERILLDLKPERPYKADLAQKLAGLKFTEEEQKLGNICVAIQSVEHDFNFDGRAINAENIAELLEKANITFHIRNHQGYRGKDILFELKPGSQGKDGLRVLDMIAMMENYNTDPRVSNLEEWINANTDSVINNMTRVKCGDSYVSINTRRTKISGYRGNDEIYSISVLKPNPKLMLDMLRNVLQKVLTPSGS